MPSSDAALFDNDGVLVEPPAAETQRAATREAFRSVGVPDPADRHVDDLTSGVTVEALERLGDAYGVDAADRTGLDSAFLRRPTLAGSTSRSPRPTRLTRCTTWRRCWSESLRFDILAQ